MHVLFVSILLGLSAAAVIGPINIEMIRRSLRYGSRFAAAIGLGASSADLTYMVLILLGLATVLKHPSVLSIVGFCGAIILAWFGYKALTAPVTYDETGQTKQMSFRKSIIAGYFMTLSNPYTILFWASVSGQLSSNTFNAPHSLIFASIGVIVGTITWVIILVSILHHTKHKLSQNTIKWINWCGGVVLIAFAFYSLIHAVHLLK